MGGEPPVRLGSMLFTLVEPHRGHQVAYNRWYERDHFYAGCMVGPGILAGRRFVATRDHKAARYPTDSPVVADRSAGSYLALYWIERNLQDEWGAWAAKEVHALHAAGRMFAERDHVHTKMYRYRWGTFRDPDGVPAELALDHAFPGLAVTFCDATGDREAAAAWFADDLLPRTVAGSPVAMCLGFTPVPIPAEAPSDVPRIDGDQRRMVHLWFCDADPLDAWDAIFAGLGKQIDDSGHARLLWAGPFIPTIPGTDAYTDRLW